MRGPGRVYPTNTPVEDLQVAEMFLVATLRLWAAPHRDPAATHPHWRTGFSAGGLDDDGASAFDGLLRVIAIATRRPLDIRCVKCPRLGEDEASFLQLIGLIQRGCKVGADLILAEWLPPAAARTALSYAVIVAMALRGRDLVVPQRPSLAAPRRAARS